MAREWKSREEYKKEKELEEARKAGTVAPEQDEEGRDINPHIPQYIRNAPWYLKARPDQGPSLRHQRLGTHKQSVVVSSLDTRIGKGEFLGPAATKYRKGACENCGSMTHSKKDCTSRPRKIGAKYKPIDIQPDERIIPEVPLSYDGKRDRWNGYDPDDYRAVMEQYEEMDQERRRRKLQEQASKFQADADPAHKCNPPAAGDKDEQKDHKGAEDKEKEDEDEEGDDFKDSEKDTFSKRDPRTRTTIRNLRIREDTAKYLRNLDPNSAFYDPKSRFRRQFCACVR
jgi:pre-mRNA-processing factor SLU7